MKKILSLILAVVMISAMTATAVLADGLPFTDVKTGRWSYDAIKYAYDRKYMDGTGGGKFTPAGTMTRAMVVTVLYRMEGAPEVSFSDEFTDVKDGKWYSDAVIWAKGSGVVNGTSETTFTPEGKITREQLATMLCRYTDHKGLKSFADGDLDSFADASKVSEYATEAMIWASGYGIITGIDYGDETDLDPRGNATREQFATILKRFEETEIPTLVEYYTPYAELIADHAENWLRTIMADLAADPDYSIHDLHNWGVGHLLIGVNEMGRYDVVEEYADMWLAHKDRGVVLSTDAGLAGYVMIDMYERTGEEKYKTLVDECLEGLLARPTDEYGEIRYDRNEDSNDVYVDGTGMCTPFLARYASAFGDEEVRKIAVLQVTNYLRMGVHPKLMYVYHGYTGSGGFAGEMGWGRGTGYLMCAIGNVMRYCDDDEANAACETFIASMMTRLKADNKFGWSLSRRDAASDTSATGKIMWGVLLAKQVGLAECVSDSTVKAIARAGLTDVYEDGEVRGSSGGSGGFGSYSENYDENTSYGEGAMLSFYALFLKYLENN